MADMKAMIDLAESRLLHTYNRYQIVLDHGDGVYLYDVNGKKYLDFVAGIAVFAFGYNYPGYNDALKAQIDKIVHTSNYFYNEPAIEAAGLLEAASGMDRVFFTNSGAESVEGALKSAQKYAWYKDHADDHEIIAMENSFHGRTYGALSVTGNAHYREAYGYLPGVVKFAQLNDLESVKAQLTDKTCAIITEVVQGEGGLTPATPEFLQGLRDLCDERDMLLIFDEIQCGMGRTGYMFAHQKFGIKPDIMTVAKALGCGLPIGAFLMTEKVAKQSLGAGDHGSTYGGNPLVTAAAVKVLKLYQETGILEHVRAITPVFEAKLDALMAKYDCITERRGSGLMQGLYFNGSVNEIILDAMDHGLMLINAGSQILRFIPPLIITEENIDEMISILEPCIQRYAEKHSA